MRITHAHRLAAVALLLALLLGVAVAAGWTQPGDARLLACLRHAGGDGWMGAVIDLTAVGSAAVLLPVLAAGAILLLVRHDRHAAAALITVVLGGRMLIEIAKHMIVRVRPPIDGLVVHGWSFPSAHAGNSTVTLLALALFLARGTMRRLAIGIALLLAFAIGWTRLWLGVHWPSDVVAGWLFGIGWVTLGFSIARVRRSQFAV